MTAQIAPAWLENLTYHPACLSLEHQYSVVNAQGHSGLRAESPYRSGWADADGVVLWWAFLNVERCEAGSTRGSMTYRGWKLLILARTHFNNLTLDLSGPPSGIVRKEAQPDPPNADCICPTSRFFVVPCMTERNTCLVHALRPGDRWAALYAPVCCYPWWPLMLPRWRGIRPHGASLTAGFSLARAARQAGSTPPRRTMRLLDATWQGGPHRRHPQTAYSRRVKPRGRDPARRSVFVGPI